MTTVKRTNLKNLSNEEQKAIYNSALQMGRIIPEQNGTNRLSRSGHLHGSDFSICMRSRMYFGEADQSLKNFGFISRDFAAELADLFASQAELHYSVQRASITAFYAVLISADRYSNWFSPEDAYSTYCHIYAKANKKSRKLGKLYKIGAPASYDQFTAVLNTFASLGFIRRDTGGCWIRPDAMTLCSINTLKKNMPADLITEFVFHTVQKTYSDGRRTYAQSGDVLKIVTNTQVLWADAVAFCMQPMVGAVYFQLLTRVRLCDDQFSISVDRLSDKLHVSGRQVRRILHRLEELGIAAFGYAPSKTNNNAKRNSLKKYAAGCIGIAHALCGRLSETVLNKVLAVFGASSITDKIIDAFGWFARREKRRAESNTAIRQLTRKAEEINRSFEPEHTYDVVLA